ncbi:hypothetical protein IWX64_000579 [Arthrobacter sp. CAN_A212]
MRCNSIVPPAYLLIRPTVLILSPRTVAVTARDVNYPAQADQHLLSSIIRS